MKKKKNPLRLVVIVVIIIVACVLLVRHFHIDNFRIISTRVLYTSGQPKGMDYTRLLYKYHIRTIINLRDSTEHRERNWYPEEITWVQNNGVKYVEMPLDKNIDKPAHFPDADMQQKFLDIMADKENLPVLIHDSSGESRVAIMAAVWLAKSRQQSIQQVLAEAEKIKQSLLVESEKTFIADLFK
jgi:protein tyrosine/serine phosphatase